MRGQHLQIVISLTGQGLTTNYSIANWEEHQTNIGSPGMGGNYELKDWGNSNDIVIGGGGSGDLPVLPGTVIWQTDNNFSLPISGYESSYKNYPIPTDTINRYFINGNILGFYLKFTETNSNEHIVRIMRGGNGITWNDLPSIGNNGYTITTDDILEFPLTDGDISQITEGNGMGFWGDGITITKIYIKVPTN